MDIQIPDTKKKTRGDRRRRLCRADHRQQTRQQTFPGCTHRPQQLPPIPAPALPGSFLRTGAGVHLLSFPQTLSPGKDFYFRMAEVKTVCPAENRIVTTIGQLHYDYLILAGGTTTNYFGNKILEENSLPMKDVREALALRSSLLLNMERALDNVEDCQRRALLNIVIVGGGATGVEIAGRIGRNAAVHRPERLPRPENPDGRLPGRRLRAVIGRHVRTRLEKRQKRPRKNVRKSPAKHQSDRLSGRSRRIRQRGQPHHGQPDLGQRCHRQPLRGHYS